MTEEQGLTEALQRHAERVGTTHPLTLQDVQGRARGIRRRRAVLSGLAAVTVLAVTAPIGLSLSGSNPPVPPVAGPRPDTSGVLRTDVAATSDEPGVIYLDGGTAHLPDGRTIPVDTELDRVAPFGDGLVATELATGGLVFVDGSGTVSRTQPSTGEFAVSSDGTVVVWATPGRRLISQGTSGTWVEVPRPYQDDPPGTSLYPKIIKGSETCSLDEGPGCVVYYDVQTGGEGVRAFHSTSKRITAEHPELVSFADESVDGRLSGLTELREDGSVCSGLTGPDGTLAWETCDYTLGAFSPDGRYVLGLPSYLSGTGATSMAIIDVETHRVVAEWGSDPGAGSFVATQPVWDTDGTVLGQVYDGRWSLMRFSPDGGLTKVMELDSRDETTPPLRLPSAR